MTSFNHGAFVDELRRRRGTIPQDLYDDMIASIEHGFSAPERVNPAQPAWLLEAKAHIGLKEIPGPRHNSKILAMVKALGGWFTDDETPWCGTFVGYCMLRAGITPAKNWYRAKDWMNWGKPTPPRFGAVAVFGRVGGGHVGFVLGESASSYYILGGNQSNEVNITPISKARLLGFRWPMGQEISQVRLATMTGGTVSRNEA